jgi:uncharacterized protein YjbI with pentapeptide repeats
LVGGVFTVAATAFGIWDSYNKTLVDREKTRISEARDRDRAADERERARIADQRARFEDAIKRLELPNTISKLVGVSILSGYLGSTNDEAHRQVLFTLAGLLASERDPQTVAAVIDLVASLPAEGPITRPEWHYFQDMLATQSRALIAKSDLYRHRHYQSALPLQSATPLNDDERAAATVGKVMTMNVRKGAVPDYTNYRGIYCGSCDWRGIVFPPRADFSNAVLDHANFSGATLVGALFDDAELLGTSFVEADLRKTYFRSLGLDVNGDIGGSIRPILRTMYLDHAASALGANATIDLKMPNFSCANLEGANFDRHALLPVTIELKRVYDINDEQRPLWYENVPATIKDEAKPREEFSAIRVLPPKFFRANLANAEMKEIRFFDFSNHDDDPIVMGAGRYIKIGDIWSKQGYDIDDEALRSGEGEELYNPEIKVDGLVSFRRRLRATFYGAELEHASLPENVKNFLKERRGSNIDYSAVFVGPTYFSSNNLNRTDTDWNCVPRRSGGR